jgi:hypothetical protein
MTTDQQRQQHTVVAPIIPIITHCLAFNLRMTLSTNVSTTTKHPTHYDVNGNHDDATTNDATGNDEHPRPTMTTTTTTTIDD